MQSRSEQAIRDITAAARACFLELGYGVATIDAIAAGAGRTKGAVYHHFADKEALFRAVFIEEQRQIATVTSRAASDPDPVRALADGLAAYLHLVGRAPDRAQLTLVQAPQVLGWDEWRACDGGPFRVLLRLAFERVAAAGRLRSPADPTILSELVLGATTEAALRIVGDDHPRRAAVRHVDAVRLLIADLTIDPPD